MRKIVKKRQLFNKRLVLNIILVLFMFLSIGYSTLSTNLNILGNLEVKKYYEHTFYNVLAKEAETGGLAREYTGAHQDSIDSSLSTEKVFYWNVSNTSQGEQVLDKNNVIFAGHCWQMLRTTDTGGVKMIYNGKAINNQCLNTREDQNYFSQGGRSQTNLSGTYIYGDKLIYDEENNMFKIGGNVVSGSIASDISQIFKKYTCKLTSETDECSTAYFFDEIVENSSSQYVYTFTSNTTHYSQIGTSPFNSISNSLGSVGYMYPSKKTSVNHKNIVVNGGQALWKRTMSSTTNYYYSDSVVFNGNNYQLVNSDSSPISVYNWETDYSNLKHMYTCASATSGSCNSVSYVIVSEADSMYYQQLSGGALSPNQNILLSSSIIEDGNNFRLDSNGLVSISREDWLENYSNYLHYYHCKSFEDSVCSKQDMFYITTPNAASAQKAINAISYKYSRGVSYENGHYVLDNDTAVNVMDLTQSSNRALVSNAHYTCLNEIGECEKVYFVYYYATTGNLLYYIALSNGKIISDKLYEQLSADNVNEYDSPIKRINDIFAENYLIDYLEYIEDIIYCNDRSIQSLGAMGETGDITPVSGGLSFNKKGFVCSQETDRFSVQNSKAQLKYPIGIMTQEEMGILNGLLKKTTKEYWIMTPYCQMGSSLYINRINTSGGFITSNSGVNNANTGVRPTISLRPGLMYESGDGSMASPYIVKYD